MVSCGGERNRSILSVSPTTACIDDELLSLLFWELLRWREPWSRPSMELNGKSSSESTGVRNDGVNDLEKFCWVLIECGLKFGGDLNASVFFAGCRASSEKVMSTDTFLFRFVAMVDHID